MGSLRIQIIDGQITLIPDEEARKIIAAYDGDSLTLSTDETGRLTASLPGGTREERLARGKAFFERYRGTFEDLAK